REQAQEGEIRTLAVEVRAHGVEAAAVILAQDGDAGDHRIAIAGADEEAVAELRPHGVEPLSAERCAAGGATQDVEDGDVQGGLLSGSLCCIRAMRALRRSA